MNDEMKEIVGSNLYNNPISVKHAELERVGDNSIFRSVCPVCKEGMLMVRRDSKTFKLMPEDNCILCGQEVFYADIDELREKASEA